MIILHLSFCTDNDDNDGNDDTYGDDDDGNHHAMMKIAHIPLYLLS